MNEFEPGDEVVVQNKRWNAARGTVISVAPDSGRSKVKLNIGVSFQTITWVDHSDMRKVHNG